MKESTAILIGTALGYTIRVVWTLCYTTLLVSATIGLIYFLIAGPWWLYK